MKIPSQSKNSLASNSLLRNPIVENTGCTQAGLPLRCFPKAYSRVTSSQLSTTHQQWPLLHVNQSTEGRHRVSSNGGRLNGNWPFSRNIPRVPFDENEASKPSPGRIDRGKRKTKRERIEFANSFLNSLPHSSIECRNLCRKVHS